MDTGTNGTTEPAQEVPVAAENVSESKGKGKAVDPNPDVAMDEDDDEEEEEEEEDPVGFPRRLHCLRGSVLIVAVCVHRAPQIVSLLLSTKVYRD